MVVAKTVFEVGGDLTRRGEILVGGPVHVAHIVFSFLTSADFHVLRCGSSKRIEIPAPP